jgi:hypothetical protein
MGVVVRLVARFRTAEGKIVRLGIGADMSGAAGERSGRATPPPVDLVPQAAATEDKDDDRDPWWFLRSLAQESYQKHF